MVISARIDIAISSGVIAPRSRPADRKSTRLNSSHGYISYAVFCLKKKKTLATPSLHRLGDILDAVAHTQPAVLLLDHARLWHQPVRVLALEEGPAGDHRGRPPACH